MKFSKGKVNNINKKLIAGTLALTLLTIPLCGCSGMELKYKENSRGEMVCVGNVKYIYLQNYKVLVLGKDDEQFFYIVRLESTGDYGSNEACEEYYDVFGGDLVYSTDIETEYKMITVIELNDYLVSYDMIRKEYSEQELKDLLENIKKDFDKKTEKQLIK